MRVTMFARVDTALNPYLLLFKRALESQGLTVSLEREFGLPWLLRRSRACDAVHLHWIESAYMPAPLGTRNRLAVKLLNNHVMRPLRAALRLTEFILALVGARLAGKRIVYTVHNLEPHGRRSRWVGALRNLAHRVVLRLAHRVHAHNAYSASVLESRYGRAREVLVLPHGNYAGVYPNSVARGEARARLQLPDRAFVYLFLGLIRPYKGVDELIAAFRQAACREAHLLIVGRLAKGADPAEFASRANGHGSIRLVLEFVPDEDVQVYMNAADACVLPYRDVTTSAAALLALTFGRPIIAPAIGSFPELVNPSTGVLYDPAQPGALALALQQASERRWSEAEIVAYARRFDWDALAPRLAALYQP